MELVYILAAVFVIYILVNKVKSKGSVDKDEKISEEEKLPYYKNKYLLTKAENNFYKSLKIALNEGDYYICPKTRVVDVLSIGKTEKKQTYFNKIKAKHIDFLICKDDMFFNPVLAIELDDSSHNAKNRVERDAFINKAFEAAKLPLYRVKASNSYQPNRLKKEIFSLLGVDKVVENKSKKVVEEKTESIAIVNKYNEYKDIKIGALVRKTFPELIENNLISNTELSKLLTYDYC